MAEAFAFERSPIPALAGEAGALEGVSLAEQEAFLGKYAIEVLGSGSREIFLPKMQTYEQPRNKAFEIIGELHNDPGVPHIGNVGVGEGKIVGRSWCGKKLRLRLDYDPKKGPHINIDDFRLGKGAKATKIVILFEGDLSLVKNLLKHLNK